MTSTTRTALRTLTITIVAVLTVVTAVIAGSVASAATGKVVRLEFEPGTNGSSFSGSIVRGDTDRYHLGATAGQTMSVGMVSNENNALFAIYTPSGYPLATEEFDRSVLLPESGDYVLEISSTRGNAHYEGYVWIGW